MPSKLATTWESGRRRLRGAARRARDAGALLRTGTVPPGRAGGLPPERTGGLPPGRAGELPPGGADGLPPLYYGWTRYSAHLPDHRGLGFRATRRFPDEQDYLAHLWDEERMSVRAQVFLELSVPVLQRLRDTHDYRHVVTYSPEMPEPWLGQLREAAQRYDVLDLRPASEGTITDIVRADLQGAAQQTRPVVWFRLDDDDLLSTDYLDLLDGHVTTHGPMWAVSLSKGVRALWHEGRASLLRGTHRPLGSQGQACIGRWDAERGILDIPEPGNHTTVDTRVPTVLDSRRATFVQLVHTGQDTRTDTQSSFEELKAAHLRNKVVVTRPERLLPRFPTLGEVYDHTG